MSHGPWYAAPYFEFAREEWRGWSVDVEEGCGR